MTEISGDLSPRLAAEATAFADAATPHAGASVSQSASSRSHSPMSR